MDSTFWIGMGIGAVFSLVASIVANLLTNPLRTFVKHRRKIGLNKQKARELAKYKIASAILSGDEAAKARLAYMKSEAIHNSIIWFVAFVASAMMFRAGIEITGPAMYDFSLGLISTMVLIIVMLDHSQLRECSAIIDRLENFETYKAALVEKWGAKVLDEQRPN
jgi:hypothetical protein